MVAVLGVHVRGRNHRGTAMVEMAFVLPLLLLLLFGVLEFGRLFVEWQIVQSAANSGVRSASLYRAECTAATVEQEVRATVDAVISANPLTRRKTREIVVDNPCSTQAERLSCVTVRLQSDYGVLAGFASLFSSQPDVTLEAISVMRPEAATGAATGTSGCTAGV